MLSNSFSPAMPGDNPPDICWRNSKLSGCLGHYASSPRCTQLGCNFAICICADNHSFGYISTLVGTLFHGDILRFGYSISVVTILCIVAAVAFSVPTRVSPPLFQALSPSVAICFSPGLFVPLDPQLLEQQLGR